MATLHEPTGVPVRHMKAFLVDVAATGGAEHIVSVGSGTGAYEFAMTQGKPALRKRLILVDPDPYSFQSRRTDGAELPPDFATVPDLVKARPEVVGNCVLLLIWPSPNESHYDFDAIYELNPRGIFLMLEGIDPPNACDAGGRYLQNALMRPEFLVMYGFVKEVTYRLERNSPRLLLAPFVPAEHRRGLVRLMWLAKRGVKVPVEKESAAIQAEANKMAQWEVPTSGTSATQADTTWGFNNGSSGKGGGGKSVPQKGAAGGDGTVHFTYY